MSAREASPEPPSAKPRGRRPTAAARRETILEQAGRLFDERGYHATSMLDIAKAVGIRKPSLYYYFETKAQILTTLHAEFIDQLIQSQEARMGVLGGEELVRDLIRENLALIRDRRANVRTFFEHHRELPEEVQAATWVKRQRYRDMVTDSLRAVRKDLNLADLDPELAMHAVLGMATWAYHWYGPDDPRPPEEVSDAFARIVLAGLLPRE